MDITVRIPDQLARRFGTAGEIERRALEALALEEYKGGHLTRDELGDVLGLQALNEIDGFLKAHGVFEPYTLTELDREVQALERLGF